MAGYGGKKVKYIIRRDNYVKFWGRNCPKMKRGCSV